MSFRASPAWNSTSDCEPSAIEAPISACGAEAVGPADAPGREQGTASQPRLISGESEVAVEEQHPDRVGRPRSSRDRTRPGRSGRRSRSGRGRPSGRTAPRAAGGTRGCRCGPCPRRACSGSAPSRPRPARAQAPHRDRRFATPHRPEPAGGPGAAGRPARLRSAISPGRQAPRRPAPSTGPRSNPPKVPSASETQIRPLTPSTTSARRAGAPDHPGRSSAAHPVGAEGERREHGAELDGPDQVCAGGQRRSLAGAVTAAPRSPGPSCGGARSQRCGRLDHEGALAGRDHPHAPRLLGAAPVLSDAALATSRLCWLLSSGAGCAPRGSHARRRRSPPPGLRRRT